MPRKSPRARAVETATAVAASPQVRKDAVESRTRNAQLAEVLQKKREISTAAKNVLRSRESPPSPLPRFDASRSSSSRGVYSPRDELQQRSNSPPKLQFSSPGRSPRIRATAEYIRERVAVEVDARGFAFDSAFVRVLLALSIGYFSCMILSRLFVDDSVRCMFACALVVLVDLFSGRTPPPIILSLSGLHAVDRSRRAPTDVASSSRAPSDFRNWTRIVDETTFDDLKSAAMSRVLLSAARFQFDEVDDDNDADERRRTPDALWEVALWCRDARKDPRFSSKMLVEYVQGTWSVQWSHDVAVEFLKLAGFVWCWPREAKYDTRRRLSYARALGKVLYPTLDRLFRSSSFVLFNGDLTTHVIRRGLKQQAWAVEWEPDGRDVPSLSSSKGEVKVYTISCN